MSGRAGVAMHVTYKASAGGGPTHVTYKASDGQQGESGGWGLRPVGRVGVGRADREYGTERPR